MKRRIFVGTLLLLGLVGIITLGRRAGVSRTAPAAWGTNNPANRMRATVVGDIVLTSVRSSMSVPARQTPFRISVDGEKWNARLDYGTNNYPGSSGTNNFQLAGFDGSKSGTALVDPKPDLSQPEHDSCAAEIYGSSYAAGADPAIRLAWLAFAAAPFFRSTNSGDFSAPWDMGFMRPEAHAIRVSKVEFIPGSPDLPSLVEMVISTQPVLRDITNVPSLSAVVSPQAVKKTMDELWIYENRLCARYQVLSTTNFQGKVYPLTFELSLMDYTFPFGTKVDVKYRGTIRAITADVPEKFLPNVGWAITAMDFRFVDRVRRIDSIWTRVSDGIWPEKDDPELQKTFRPLQTPTEVVERK